MMSLETIRTLNAQAGRKARRNGVKPKQFTADELHLLRVGDLTPFKRIPKTGDHCPKGWRVVQDHFVDSSGFGQPGELAMTPQAFARVVVSRPDSAWGLGEEGQFQLYVTEFERGAA